MKIFVQLPPDKTVLPLKKEEKYDSTGYSHRILLFLKFSKKIVFIAYTTLFIDLGDMIFHCPQGDIQLGGYFLMKQSA
jgi:hypothetical protein